MPVALKSFLLLNSPLNQWNVAEMMLFLLWTQLQLMLSYLLEALRHHTEKRETQTKKKKKKKKGRGFAQQAQG